MRHKSKVGELEGEVRGLHQSQAAKQATLATDLRQANCASRYAPPHLQHHLCLDLSKLCSRHAGAGYPPTKYIPVAVRLEALYHALKLEQEIM